MARYSLQLIVHSGSDEFWETVEEKPFSPDVDLLLGELKDALEDRGFDRVTLELTDVEFKPRAPALSQEGE